MQISLIAFRLGHMGLATVHSDSVYNTIDRLTTLVKRDPKTISYKESFVSKMIASSIDYIIFMKNYKVYSIAEVKYNRDLDKVCLNILFEYNEKNKKYINS